MTLTRPLLVLIRLLALASASVFDLGIRFRVVPFLEGLDPFPCNWYHDPCPIEPCQVVRCIVICARYHVRSKPPPHKFLGRPVLVVEAAVVDQHPIAFLDPLQSEPVCPVEPTLVPPPRLFNSRCRSLDVFRSSLELLDLHCQQLLSAHFLRPVDHHPRRDCPSKKRSSAP
mgnify:CR=1 FL=1